MIWVQTYTGIRFDLEHPTCEMVDIEDIAHALAYQCRFTGHSLFHYSIAQHSVLVSQKCLPTQRLEGLLHDAAEAYIGDVNAPLKSLLPDYQCVERRIHQVVAWRFGLPDELSPEVKVVDARMCLTEKRTLFKDALDWEVPFEPYPDSDVYIAPWTMETAERAFLREFYRLKGENDG